MEEESDIQLRTPGQDIPNDASAFSGPGGRHELILKAVFQDSIKRKMRGMSGEQKWEDQGIQFCFELV